ncbi:hypothetical protein TSUD_104990 [Trifolium subterraneum]|uniref:Uncharacterized protein n=1 Tax=Trifolium subterraneum TaxID=3900 RepID=A0A2Z6N4Q5_TRISU|nr:hypothetical protein TSUD_104990 [Trifolium subterraneum]
MLLDVFIDVSNLVPPTCFASRGTCATSCQAVLLSVTNFKRIFLHGDGNARKVATKSNCSFTNENSYFLCMVQLHIPSVIHDGIAASLKDVIDSGYDLFEPYVNSSYVAIRRDLIVKQRLVKDLIVAIIIWTKSVPIEAIFVTLSTPIFNASLDKKMKKVLSTKAQILYTEDMTAME